MAKIGSDKPRPQAYEFAHQAVRAVARQDPTRFCELVELDRLPTLLTELWNKIGEHLSEDERLPADRMRTSMYRVGDRSIVIIQPPLAEHITEAHFIGIVIEGDDLERHFVLEHSWNLDDTPSTWMGEWEPTGHFSLGDGSSPDSENRFLREVLSRL